MVPREGEAFLSAAITLQVSRVNAPGKSRGGASFPAAILRGTSGRTRLRCATDVRRAATIWSRMVFPGERVCIKASPFHSAPGLYVGSALRRGTGYQYASCVLG